MHAFYLPTKVVTFGDFTMRIPATWGFERQENGLWWWGDPSDHPGVLIGRDSRSVDPAAGDDREKAQAVADEIHEVHRDMPGLRSFDVLPHAEGLVVRVVLGDDPDGIWEIRWYTVLVLEDEPTAVVTRIKLIFRSAHRDTPLATALDSLFHDQAMVFHLRAYGDRAPRPPDGFYRPLRRVTFDGVVTCNLPLAWIARHKGNRIWWCSSDQYLGSMNVYYSWFPMDLDEVDVPASLAETASAAARRMLDDRREVGIDLESGVGWAVAHFTYDDTEDDPEREPDDEPHRTHFWHLSRAVEGGIVLAGFDLMFPVAHADAPVFRNLVEDMALSVRTAALAPPGPQPPPPLDDDARQFDMNLLRAHTCFDFINICVPRRWIWDEWQGSWGFFAEDEDEESGTLWVDWNAYRLKEGEVGAPAPMADTALQDAMEVYGGEGQRGSDGAEKTDLHDGTAIWRTYSAEEKGEMLRFYRCDRFLTRPDGLYIVHFSLVLLESQADDPEFVELVETVGREIEAAIIL
ncbi:MAG: hypothetical protein H6907_04185 [Hyphomicrobiales bacterium]|nr:hypothetical protein [Hyphomicrobiales bacterium]